MSHRHMNLYQRRMLVKLLQNGSSQREIANYLDFSQATISKEIRRNSNYKKQYIPETAEHKAVERRRRASSKRNKQTEEIIRYISGKLELYWSPEQIAGRMRLENLGGRVCFKSIYRWLLQGQISQKRTRKKAFAYHSRYLRLKRRGKSFCRKIKGCSRCLPNLPSIEERRNTRTFGHWECDLIVGKNRSGYLVTMVERKTGYTLIEHCAKKTTELVNKAITTLFSKKRKSSIKSITYDRGKEFYGYKAVEEHFGNKSFFCHPYSPQERGLNENTNGLLRQFFPRSKDFSRITAEEINRAVDLLNHRPRKKFNYKTTVEFMEEKGWVV